MFLIFTRLQTARPAVPAAHDLLIAVADRGQSIPPKQTIMFIQLLQLDLYRNILEANGDRYIESEGWTREHPFQNFGVRIMPASNRVMTFGCAIFAVQQILFHMLNPESPGFGFFEGGWEIASRARGGRGRVPVGIIRIQVHHYGRTLL